jgi:CheY-like chemotaxis protein
MSTVLIVDDSRFSRGRLRAALEPLRLPLTLVEASDGVDALEQVALSLPDVSVTDLLMPRRNGLELLRELRSRGLATPAIVVSADIQKSSRDACAALGVHRFLNKPFAAGELQSAVTSALSTLTAASVATV